MYIHIILHTLNFQSTTLLITKILYYREHLIKKYVRLNSWRTKDHEHKIPKYLQVESLFYISFLKYGDFHNSSIERQRLELLIRKTLQSGIYNLQNVTLSYNNQEILEFLKSLQH